MFFSYLRMVYLNNCVQKAEVHIAYGVIMYAIFKQIINVV